MLHMYRWVPLRWVIFLAGFISASVGLFILLFPQFYAPLYHVFTGKVAINLAEATPKAKTALKFGIFCVAIALFTPHVLWQKLKQHRFVVIFFFIVIIKQFLLILFLKTPYSWTTKTFFYYTFLHSVIKAPFTFVFFWMMSGLFFTSFLGFFKQKKWIALTVSTLLGMIILADLLYQRAFGLLLNTSMSSASFMLKNVMGAFIALFQWYDVIFFIDLPWLYFTKTKPGRHHIFISMTIVMGCIAIVMWIKPNTKPLVLVDSIHQPAAVLSPLFAHAYQEKDFFAKKTLSSDQLTFINQWFEAKQAKSVPKHLGRLAQSNVIFITFESLENFVIGQRLEGQEITPHLNQLLKHSWRFNEIMQQIGPGMSSDGYLMYNTSIYPKRDRAYSLSYTGNHVNTVVNYLAPLGYQFGYYSPAWPYIWNEKNLARSFGYDQTFFAGDGFAIQADYQKNSTLGMPENLYMQQMVEKIASWSEPFYNFMVTIQSHTPFVLPEDNDIPVLNFSPSIQPVLARYLNTIHYTDAQLGILFDQLKQAGLWERTTIVIAGDHLGISAYNADSYPELGNNKYVRDGVLNSATSRVAFMISHPQLYRREIKTVAGQIDILPTLLTLLDVPESTWGNNFLGHDILTSKGHVINKKIIELPSELPKSEQDVINLGGLVADMLIEHDLLTEERRKQSTSVNSNNKVVEK
jgi:lipoteichoic acid synthase